MTNDIKTEEWDAVSDLIAPIFADQNMFLVNQQLAGNILQDAPWERAEDYLRKMCTWPDVRDKSYRIYSAVITMSKREEADKACLHEIVGQLIQQRADAPDSPAGDGDKETEHMLQMYRELEKLIDIESIYELEAVDTEKICRVLDTLEARIGDREKLDGYDSRLIAFVQEAFYNKNWRDADESKVLLVIDRIFRLMKRYEGKMTVLFFGDFCRLLLTIEKLGSAGERAYIGRLVTENMVRQTFPCIEREGNDSPLNTFLFDDGSRNRYEIEVTLLLTIGMEELQEGHREDAIRFVLRALQTEESIIYNYGMVLLSYYFLKGSEKIRLLSWGGLLYIQGRITIQDKKAKEIRERVESAVQAMRESTQWFGESGFSACVEKDEEYRQWIQELEVISPKLLS